MRIAEPAPPQEASAAEKSVPALVRASRILDAVIATVQPPTVSDLARRLGLPKSTVHGLCATLVDLGLLVRLPGNGFRVGPHVMRWAGAFLAQTEITTEFTAIWDQLSDLPGETITLSVLEGRDVVYVACRNSAAPLGVTFRIGMRLPAPFTATGKAILSTMGETEVRALLARDWPEPLTARSVGDIGALLRELEECRRRGYSIDDGQVREGMYCFGVPVRDATNQVIAGVAVSLLAARADAPTTRLAVGCIQTIAHHLSARLGADVRAPAG
jgi:DNA-binding IclR family transcriptional regulator